MSATNAPIENTTANANSGCLRRLVRPRVGDTWEFKTPNKPKKTKVIAAIYRMQHCAGKNGEILVLPRVQWRHAPKGRSTSIRVKWLLKYGRLVYRPNAGRQVRREKEEGHD